jgi:hypothetical protein
MRPTDLARLNEPSAEDPDHPDIAGGLHGGATSVAANMTECALHWLEFLDASERDSDRFVDAVKMENGRPTIDEPRVRSSFEQLSPDFIRIH